MIKNVLATYIFLKIWVCHRWIAQASGSKKTHTQKKANRLTFPTFKSISSNNPFTTTYYLVDAKNTATTSTHEPNKLLQTKNTQVKLPRRPLNGTDIAFGRERKGKKNKVLLSLKILFGLAKWLHKYRTFDFFHDVRNVFWGQTDEAYSPFINYTKREQGVLPADWFPQNVFFTFFFNRKSNSW